MAEREQGRGFANGTRPETGAGAPLRAEIVGRAEYRDVGVDLVPVLADRIFAEGAEPDKR